MRGFLIAVMALFLGSAAVAAELGDDGLHKAPWMQDTFKDLREDLEEANAEGKRLMVIVEQRGCLYCTKMHEEVFPREEIAALLNDRFFVVQINMFGDVDVTDFDGSAMTEKEAIGEWGLFFTPTILFFPAEVAEDLKAHDAAVVSMPGAFSASTTLDLLTWVLEEGYLGEENFQKYHARKINERAG